MPDDEPTQLDELISAYGKDKACLAAAELDIQDIDEAIRQLQEMRCHAEREFKHWQGETDKSYSAVRRRIEAQTEAPLTDEIVKGRCGRALLVTMGAQFVKRDGEEWR